MGSPFRFLGILFPARAALGRTKAHFGRGPILAKGSAAGHTLVELVFAVAIVGIVGAIGVGILRDQLVTWRLMRTGRLLQNDLHHLRALSVSTNRQARLLFEAADATLDPDGDSVGRWELQLGNRASGSTVWDTLPPDDGETVDNGQGERDIGPDGLNSAPGVSLVPWPTLEGPGAGNADAIVFSPRGWVENPASDFVNGFITVDLVNKRGLDDGRDERVRVQISRGGVARLEHGESTRVADGAVGAPEATSP